MSAYRNEYLITKVLDPVFTNQSRCVFKLPHQILLKRSIMLGQLSYLGANKNTTMIGGISNLIRNISLRVGGSQVDYNSKVSVTNLLSNLRTTATRANNIDHSTKKTSLDFKTSLSKDVPELNKYILASNFGNQVNSVEGMVYLYDVLRFFLARHNVPGVTQEVIPMNIFKNQDIELTIEWETNPQILTNQTGTIGAINAPVLIMDCLEKSSPLYSSLDNLNVVLTYDRWENETVNYNGVNAGVTNETRERLNAVNGKMLKRVAICNQSSELVADLGLITKSKALNNEKIQVVINGRQIFDFRVEESAEKVSQFTNVWGEYLLPPGGRYNEWDDAKYVTNKTSITAANTVSPIVSNASLFGFKVNQRVDYMELDHQYTADTNNEPAGNFNVIFETENMLIVMNDGTFRMAY